MTIYLGKKLFILFAASAFRKLSSIYVFSYFPFGFEGRIWDLIVSVPDHCLSFYFIQQHAVIRIQCYITARWSGTSRIKSPADQDPVLYSSILDRFF